MLSNQTLPFYFMNSLGNFFLPEWHNVLVPHTFKANFWHEVQLGWNMVMTKAHSLAALLAAVQKETLWAFLDSKRLWPATSEWGLSVGLLHSEDCQTRTDTEAHSLRLDSLPIEKMQRIPKYFTTFDDNFLQVSCTGSLCLHASVCMLHQIWDKCCSLRCLSTSDM